MKKTIASCSSLIILTCLQATFAGGPQMVAPMPDSFFDGFSVGVYGSFHHTSFNSEAATMLSSNIIFINQPLDLPSGFNRYGLDSEPASTTTNAGGTSLDAYGGAQIDYGHVFHNRWYLGGSVFGELGQAEDSNSTPANLSGNLSATGLVTEIDNSLELNTKSVANGTVSTNMEIENGVGGAIKLGMLLSDRILAYGKIGAERSRLEVTTTSTLQATTNANTLYRSATSSMVTATTNTNEFIFDPVDLSPTATAEEWKTGLVLGAGVEYAMTSSLSMFGEYTYTNYGNVDASSDVVSENQTKIINSGGFDPFDVTIQNKTSAQVANTETSAKVSAMTLGLKYKLPFWS